MIVMFLSWKLQDAETGYYHLKRECSAIVKALAEVRWGHVSEQQSKLMMVISRARGSGLQSINPPYRESKRYFSVNTPTLRLIGIRSGHLLILGSSFFFPPLSSTIWKQITLLPNLDLKKPRSVMFLNVVLSNYLYDLVKIMYLNLNHTPNLELRFTNYLIESLTATVCFCYYPYARKRHLGSNGCYRCLFLM